MADIPNRCGLADTTVRTGNLGWLIRVSNRTMTPEIMHWEQSVPIGDIPE